jgi:hypothetical protein
MIGRCARTTRCDAFEKRHPAVIFGTVSAVIFAPRRSERFSTAPDGAAAMAASGAAGSAGPAGAGEGERGRVRGWDSGQPRRT